MTQSVVVINKIVATPRVSIVTLSTSASVPALYTVVMAEQVIVRLPAVLLKIVITSPAINILAGTVTVPPELITFQTSPSSIKLGVLRGGAINYS